jgi:hypothetical protein
MSSNKEKCAPSKKFTDGSCFSIESLKKIADNYNKKNNNKIVVTTSKKELVKQLTNIFTKCDTQTCWLSNDIVKDLDDEEINNNTFRPIGPYKKYEWLSTLHIDDVIKQYEEVYDDFVFLGAVPNDFQEIHGFGFTNSEFDFNKYINNNKSKLGLVINTDNHYQSGAHWVALYTDLLNKKIYYFDSVGNKPSKQVKKFITKTTDFMFKDENINVGKIMGMIKQIKDKQSSQKYMGMLKDKLSSADIRYNHIQHQRKNTECGVYSINFILRSLKGESFDAITQNITDDDEVNKCRNVYFN